MAAEEGGAVAATVTLLSSEDEEFEVAEQVAMVSPTIERAIEDGLTRVPLQNIPSKILVKIVEFSEKLVRARAAAAVDGPFAEREVDMAWGKELVQIDPTSLTGLILAADYLEMDELLHLACERAAEVMSGRTPEEVAKMFSLKCVLTPAEEAEIRKRNK